MKKIALTKGAEVMVDDDMYNFLMRWKWGLGPSGYAVRGTTRGGRQYKNIFLHQIVAVIMYGEIPDGYSIDHIDRNRLNCTSQNIRLCTAKQNSFNRTIAPHTSIYKGVYWKKSLGKWAAQIGKDGKHTHLGYFSDEKEAAKAFDSAAKLLHGKFANLNFPE